MAIIKCHECGNNVSTEAKKCPGCGAKVKYKKPVGILGIVLAVAAGLTIFSVTRETRQADEIEQQRLASMTPEQKKAEEDKKKEKSKREDAAILCMQGAKDNLKDPDSAKFPDLYQVGVEKRKDGSYHAMFEGRAKNSFGAYVRSVFDCKIAVSSTGQQRLVSVKEVN